MKITFNPLDKVKMLKKMNNGVWNEIGRGFVSRVANDSWVYFIDKENTNQTEELVPVESKMTKIIRW